MIPLFLHLYSMRLHDAIAHFSPASKAKDTWLSDGPKFQLSQGDAVIGKEDFVALLHSRSKIIQKQKFELYLKL